jgi:site-specific DNA recombinase
MRSILYARVSLEEQAEQFGLASQLRGMREYAASKGYAGAEELSDEGYGGADIDRPALTRIRELARARQIDVVIAYDPDRLSRKRAHQFILQDEFERAGVRLEFVTTPAADTPEARMLLDIKGMFAEYEREKIRERTLRGRREKAKQGFIVGGRVPFGYRYLGKVEKEKGKLEIDERQAPAVRQIFEWAASGVSIRTIATRLNEDGVKPALAERWGSSSVSRLLQNETYVGMAHYNRRKRSEPCQPAASHRDRKNKRTILRERPEAEWIDVPAPAIIGRDLFDQVAVRLHRNRVELAGRASRRYLLRGLVWCGKCGLRMRGDPNRGTPCYRCSGRDRLRKAATGCLERTKAAQLDTAVWDAICEPFRDEKLLRSLIDRNRAEFQKTKGRPKAELKKRIDGLKLRESRGVQALLDVGREHQEMLRAELRKCSDERRRLEQELASAEVGVVEIDSLGALCREFSARLAEVDGEDRQNALRQLVERVVVRGHDVTIHCAVPTAHAQNCPQRADDRSARLREDHAGEAAGRHSAAADFSGGDRDHQDSQHRRPASERRRAADSAAIPVAAPHDFRRRSDWRRLRHGARGRSEFRP